MFLLKNARVNPICEPLDTDADLAKEIELLVKTSGE
jgi:hypothetical protein